MLIFEWVAPLFFIQSQITENDYAISYMGYFSITHYSVDAIVYCSLSKKLYKTQFNQQQEHCPYTLFNPSLVSIHESCIKIENFLLCWSMNTSLFLWINAHCTCNKLAVSISTWVNVFRNSTCILETMEGNVTEFMSVWNLVGYSFSSYCNREKVKLFYWKRFSSMEFHIQEYLPCTCVSHSMNRNTLGYKKAKMI